MFLFTSDADLFFAVALLSARRKVALSGVRRVLTFPSGVLLLRKFDLKLLVGGLGGGGGSGLGVAVRRREDAEGDGDAGFKIQGDGLSGRESPLLLDLPLEKGRKEDSSGFFS